MPPSRIIFPLLFVLLSGCAATNNYDSTSKRSTANPFDEPVSSSPLRPPALSSAPSTTPGPILESERRSMAVSYAAPPEQSHRFKVEKLSSTENAKGVEIASEADRLGALGDVTGKADLLRQAGDVGYPKAFYDLAKMYLDGSLSKDMPEAVKYVTLAHEAGYTDATRVLGMLYIRGQGMPADVEYGRKLLELASETSSRAAREYGMLLSNISSPHLNDPTLGAHYLALAAQRGDSEAQEALDQRPAPPTPQTDSADQSSHDELSRDNGGSGVSPAVRGSSEELLRDAQLILLGKKRVPDPEFTAYCWMAVAEKMGSEEAHSELRLIAGVKAISDQKNPGRMDRCIAELQSEQSRL